MIGDVRTVDLDLAELLRIVDAAEDRLYGVIRQVCNVCDACDVADRGVLRH